jgi:hypothetical protein
MKVKMGGCDGFDDEHWKEGMEAQAIHPNEPTPAVLLMGLETVKMISEVGNMETIPDEDSLAIQRDDGRPMPKNWGKGVIAHTYAPSSDRIVRDKC